MRTRGTFVEVFSNNGAPTWDFSVSEGKSSHSFGFMADVEGAVFVDLGNDGDLDIVAHGGAWGFLPWRNDGGGA